MSKLSPYQPTTAQMLAQAQAAKLAQQQAYLDQMTQMTMYNPSSQPMGAANGRHRNTSTPTSSGTLGPAYFTYVGTGGTIYYPTTLGTYAQPTELTIEEAGIRAGEITGVRAWYLRSGDELWSVYMPYVWRPGVQRIMDERVHPYHGNGFHAFKDMDQCRREYPGPGIVFGEVALWGEVYEHERGYRAECARITRLIEVWEARKEPSWCRLWRRPTIHKLREKYGVIE